MNAFPRSPELKDEKKPVVRGADPKIFQAEGTAAAKPRGREGSEKRPHG